MHGHHVGRILRRQFLLTQSRRFIHAQTTTKSSQTTTSVLSTIDLDHDPMIGDYPNLPPISRQTRPFYAEYDDPQGKSNFNETIPEEDEILNEFGPEPNTIGMGQAFRELGVASMVIGGICYLAYLTHEEPHFVPRQFPYDGLREDLAGKAAVPSS